MHLLATIAVFLVMNLFTCVWNFICLALLPESVRNLIQSIVTTVVTGGVSMVITFAVDNKFFIPPRLRGEEMKITTQPVEYSALTWQIQGRRSFGGYACCYGGDSDRETQAVSGTGNSYINN